MQRENKRRKRVERDRSTVEGGQEEQGGISPWFKRRCAHRESPAGSLGEAGGCELCICICVYNRARVCVSLCAVCKDRSAILNIPGLGIPKQPVWEYTDAPASPHLPLPHLSLFHFLCSVFSLHSPHTYGPPSQPLVLRYLFLIGV